ncbi:MAG: right-handed parallel beta-helix repeat-containing protein [Chitinophagales bacterium]|nr:right-handed parallel beta-helix repeat-containing protein [Chitinophagales bacterium]MDW8419712.1 right-handed parallel beta-helix repeat-containing protein [Chitinophagales bacterium]
MNKLTKFLTGALIAATLPGLAGDCPALSGEFTIGSSESADFNTIGDAINALKCGGVNAPVTFYLEDGTYEERVVISDIPGASAYNTIKFESKSGNNSEVVISYRTTDATLVLNGTAYVTFENLTIDHKNATYGNAVRIDGKAHHLTFKGVVFDGVEANRTGSNTATVYITNTAPKHHITIQDCEINNGSVGIFKSGMSAENPDTKTLITGTLFFNQYETGIYLANEDAPVITNNVISSLSNFSSYKAINLDNASNNLIVSNNIINASNGSYGLVMNNCVAQATGMGQINNNSIAVGGNNETYGVYLTGNTDNQILNYNRIKLTINNTPGANQAYYRNHSSGNNINMLNNILYDLSTGGYTIIGNTYKDFFNQLPSQSNPSLTVSANGIMIEKVSPIK